MSDAERAAWLRWRRGGIGASDVAGILGISPWASPWSVYASKVGEVTDEDNESMEFGRRAEPMLAEWFHARHPELWVLGEQTRCSHRDEPWMMCTVDGFLYETPEPEAVSDYVGVVEFKTTADTAKSWAERIPDHYAAQAAWTMAVCDCDVVHFGVLHLAFGRPAFRTYEFHRDLDDEALIVTACTEFWTDHVQAGVPPERDDHPATHWAIGALYPENTDAVVTADDELRSLVDEYRYHRAEAKAAAERQEAVGDELRMRIADAEGITDGVDDRAKWVWLATWRSHEVRKLDTKRLRTERPDVAAEFTTTTTQRPLLVPD